MVSGGYNSGGQKNNGNGTNIYDKGVSAFAKFGRKAGKRAGKAGAKGIQAAAKALTKMITKISPKALLIMIPVVILICLLVYGFGYYALDENTGETKNYIDQKNKVVSKGSAKKTLSSGSTSSTSDGNSNDSTSDTVEMSNANAACYAYYETLSKTKSVYQLITNDDGTTSLILASDEDAVTDYFNNDQKFYIEPNLLFCMNKFLITENYVLPEKFLQPVAYDEETFTLKDLTDEDGNVIVESRVLDSSGQDTGKTRKAVSDYGIASVVSYTKKTMTTEMKGTYIKEDYFDKTTGTVKQKAINESYSYITDSTDYDVVDKAVTMSGSITYTYTDTTVKEEGIDVGTSSSDPKDNVEKILSQTITISIYTVIQVKDGATVAGTEQKFYSLEDAQAYVAANTDYQIVTDDKGNPVVATQSYNLYKYRDTSTSGVYTNFVDAPSSDIEEKGNKYLYDYLENYASYNPVITRDYDTLLNMHSKATSTLYSNVAKFGVQGSGNQTNGVSTGKGSNKFEQLYNGSAKETIETIWDGLLSWGYSDIQAAAVLGNMTCESGFTVTVENSIGAYGLCQWYKGRRTSLQSFASSQGTTEEDLTTQIQFACMELDSNNSYNYASNQWGSNADTWETSDDVASITESMAIYWERFTTPSKYKRSSKVQKEVKKRQNCALSAYKLLKGKTFGHQLAIISPKTGNSSSSDSTNQALTSQATSSMTDEDRSAFYDFYHALDEDSLKGKKYEYYTKNLTSEEIKEMIALTNSLVEDTTKTEAMKEITGEMWSGSYITSLSDEDGTTFASTVDGLSVGSALDIGDLDFLFPVDMSGFKRFSSKFGPRSSPTAGASSNHKGVDIACDANTPIYAAADGTVEVAKNSSSAGNYVQINHGKNAAGEIIQTQYMHNNTLLVSAGDTVKRGQVIAYAGSTGASTGNHCHFTLTINGVKYNGLLAFDLSKVEVMTNGTTGTQSLSADTDFLTYLYYDDQNKKFVKASEAASNTSNSGTGADVVNYALQFVGNPYVWGGTSLTEGIDCSGFTMKVYEHFGISLPHHAASQAKKGKQVKISELQAGDLLFYGKGNSITHVAIYMGNGQVVHASSKKTGIKTSKYNYRTIIKAARLLK